MTLDLCGKPKIVPTYSKISFYIKIYQIQLLTTQKIGLQVSILGEGYSEFAKITVSGYILGSNSEISNV